jgi:hypothetical protein
MFVAVDHVSRRGLVLVAAAEATLVLWFPPSVNPQPPEWLLLVILVVVAAVAAAVLPVGQDDPSPLSGLRRPPPGTPQPRR